MKKLKFGLGMVVCLVMLMTLLPASAMALDMGLVSMLVSKLGVTEKQAEGGAGAIFKTAQSRMTESDYKQLSDSVPEADALQSSAPEPSASKGLVSGAASMLGGKAGSSLEGGTGLLSSFKELGMDSEMLGQFTPVIYDYVKEKGGSMVMEMLQKALTF
ncbi:MAG: DUF2780 domain-containing protein [Deltaproteobacteria bacterium]|nr:DUF2780 domain-containing protein [Candidatus Tharpella aukensis]